MYKEIAKEKFNKLKKEYKTRDIYVLGIESSCDETSISIVKNGREIISNIVATQIDIHAKFGGVVPEVASRNHLLSIDSVLEECLATSKMSLKEIDAIDKNTDLARLKITCIIEKCNLFCENNVTTKAKEFSIILD